MHVSIQYFAVLREQRGESSEDIETSCKTPVDLYRHLQLQNQLSVPIDSLRVAINDEFASMDDELRDGDTIAFIAPVAGG